MLAFYSETVDYSLLKLLCRTAHILCVHMSYKQISALQSLSQFPESLTGDPSIKIKVNSAITIEQHKPFGGIPQVIAVITVSRGSLVVTV